MLRLPLSIWRSSELKTLIDRTQGQPVFVPGRSTGNKKKIGSAQSGTICRETLVGRAREKIEMKRDGLTGR